jgi:hypothetical protein
LRHRRKAELEAEEEVLEAAIAAIIGSFLTIVDGGEKSEVNGPVLKNGGNKEGKIIKSRLIGVYVCAEGLKEFGF